MLGNPAFSTTANRLPPEVPVIAALIVMLPLAFNVSVEVPPPFFVIEPVASTVIFPASLPDTFPVETVTLVPALNDVFIELA